jgi:hypothetical protein
MVGFIGRPLHLMERDVIIGTLQATGGNRTRTAAMLGLSIRALRNKISLYAAQGIAVPANTGPPTSSGPTSPGPTSPGAIGSAPRITDARTP